MASLFGKVGRWSRDAAWSVDGSQEADCERTRRTEPGPGGDVGHAHHLDGRPDAGGENASRMIGCSMSLTLVTRSMAEYLRK